MLSACACATPSPLKVHADHLQNAPQLVSSQLRQFTMYVVPVETLLSMREVQSYEELHRDGVLVEYDESQGNAMFVSHQWTGGEHPDGSGEQFAVLKDALQALMSGKVDISGNISMELYRGQQNTVSAKEIFASSLFIWYDYICIPQHHSATAVAMRQMAVNSIPGYVDRCQFFIILCPHVRHTQTTLLLNKRSWSSRGWCRLEQLARELSTREGSLSSIEMHGSTHLVEAPTYGWMQKPVGEGNFGREQDRGRIALVVQDMVKKKLHSFLQREDFNSYRMMLNLQNVYYRNLRVAPMDDFIPGFVSNSPDPGVVTVQNFMHQNGFESISDRDSEGWSPICFAALDGRPLLIAALLDRNADVNDRVTQQSSVPFGQCPLLHICAFLSHNDAVNLLIQRRADVHARDGYGATALPWAAFSDNVEGLQSLIAAGTDPGQVDMLGYAPFTLASSAGSLASMSALLPYTPREEMDKTLNVAMLQGGGSAQVVSTLISLAADVNHQSSTPLLSPLGIWLGCLNIRHHFSESKLSAYACHYEGMTPLMCSILTNSFEATAVLLGVGARTDLQNARGKTAVDLAMESATPSYIVHALKDEGDARSKLVQEVAEFVEGEMVSESF